MTGLIDRALDLTVVPGYSRLGYRMRHLNWEEAVGRTPEGPDRPRHRWELRRR